MNINYQKVMEETLASFDLTEKNRKTLLLHSCCAPCSSYVLKTLTEYFDIFVFYYNPNIYPFDEYEKRLNELKKLINLMEFKGKISLLEESYDYEEFKAVSKGLENEQEGGIRCTECFKLRLEKTAEKAKELGTDFFTTTLTVSPHKNSKIINEIGEEISKNSGVLFLHSDFKKKEGYKQSIQLSEKYGLYRQNYCGCTLPFTNEKK